MSTIKKLPHHTHTAVHDVFRIPLPITQTQLNELCERVENKPDYPRYGESKSRGATFKGVWSNKGVIRAGMWTITPIDPQD
jgi:hypothetical protein